MQMPMQCMPQVLASIQPGWKNFVSPACERRRLPPSVAPLEVMLRGTAALALAAAFPSLQCRVSAKLSLAGSAAAAVPCVSSFSRSTWLSAAGFGARTSPSRTRLMPCIALLATCSGPTRSDVSPSRARARSGASASASREAAAIGAGLTAMPVAHVATGSVSAASRRPSRSAAFPEVCTTAAARDASAAAR